MKNLEQYKSRFYDLMESTLGNVKPLLTEGYSSGLFDAKITEPHVNKFFNDVGNYIFDSKVSLMFINDPEGTNPQPSCFGGSPAIFIGEQQPNKNWFQLVYNTKANTISWNSAKEYSSIQPGGFVIRYSDQTGTTLSKQTSEDFKNALIKIKSVDFKNPTFGYTTGPSCMNQNRNQQNQQNQQNRKQPNQKQPSKK